MYEKYFYFKEKPFHITPDPKFLYLSRNHREAIDLMNFGIREKKGFIMLSGEVGTGKTTLCRALIDRLPAKVGTALILNPVLSGKELLKTIVADFGLKSHDRTLKGHMDCLNEFLLKSASAGGTAAIIIDEAQNLSTETLEMLRLLSNLETEKEKLLQIVLVGQPELRDKLGMPELRQLNQRVIVRHHLLPLDMEETDAYIRNRLFVAGGASTVRFTDDSVKAVYSASTGIPRMINIICDRALTAAFVLGKKTIAIESVEEAVDELRREGYIRDAAPALPSESQYLRYLPHFAFSAFVISLIAGMFIGSLIIKNTLLFPLSR